MENSVRPVVLDDKTKKLITMSLKGHELQKAMNAKVSIKRLKPDAYTKHKK